MSLDRIEQRAAEWLVREDANGWSQADRAARDAWLDEDTLHRVAWLRLKNAWTRADRLAALRSPARAAIDGRFGAGLWRALAATLAVGVLAGAAWLALGARNEGRTFQTVVGAHETVHLADGSLLELNTDTRLHALVTREQRKIVLDRGEVFLAVVHDSKRPFVVLAGEKRITDLGTKFSVRRDGDRVAVIVTEGRVRIDDLERPSSVPPVVAKPDVQVTANAQATLVAERSPQQVANALSWRSGLLVFNQQTLSEAAAEFNRYNDRKLVIEDPKVAATRIGGSFQAANVEAFAHLLREGFGYKVEESDDSLKVSQ